MRRGVMRVMKHSGHLLAAVLLIFLAAVASSSQQTSAAIDYSRCEHWIPWGSLNDLKLAQVVGAGYAKVFATAGRSSLTCSPEKGDCEFSGNVRPGLPVIMHEVRGDWTCVWRQDYWKGAGHGWMRTNRLREIPADTNPPLSAWVGAWRLLGARPRPTKKETAENDRLLIRKSQSAGALTVEGRAYFEAEHDGWPVVEYARVDSVGRPDGNHLRIIENDCEVHLKLIGSYLLANDNHQCGGLNARFGAIWQR